MQCFHSIDYFTVHNVAFIISSTVFFVLLPVIGFLFLIADCLLVSNELEFNFFSLISV